MSKVNTIDLFAGCGGLMEGFEKTNKYKTLACVEWEKAPLENLRDRLKYKWGYENADQIALRFDMQRSEELFNGWDDIEYGKSVGLDKILGRNEVDVIIGGPPCQAYSVAGRIRDVNGMRNDYRNYLFESYLKVVNRYRPKAFVFENVPGILSAMPNGQLIIDDIKDKFRESGYEILDNMRDAIFDVSEFGVPQKRKRIIILGLRKEVFSDRTEELLDYFYYNLLPSYKTNIVKTVNDAIGDLPKLYPLVSEEKIGRRRLSHSYNGDFPNHIPRWHNPRDISVFEKLTKDIETGDFRYTTTKSLRELYTRVTGKNSNVHKYHVLRLDKPSNTIPAHLYKDGLRHIHPDSTQKRTITVREAARIQTFDDDYIFIGSQMSQYKMIGNAVPPLFSKIVAEALFELIFTNNS